MAVQPILQGDIPELRQASRPVEIFDEALGDLVKNLTDTLVAHRGLGLSAPQIGTHVRVIVVDVGQGVQEFINPRIVETHGESEGYESCLSFPEHTLKIVRPACVSVTACDKVGAPVQIEASGLLARVLCHEVDHLDGVLFMDHLSDDEIFNQLLQNVFVESDDRLSEAYSEASEYEQDATDDVHRSIDPDVQSAAVQKELQMSVDMLSELSWKWVLCLEILRDYEALFSNAIDWEKLNELTVAVDSTIETVETYLQSQSEDHV